MIVPFGAVALPFSAPPCLIEPGYPDFDDLMGLRPRRRVARRRRPVAWPATPKLFSFNVYHGGALVLYALRQEIGVAAFERLEREWLHRYGGRSASSDDCRRPAAGDLRTEAVRLPRGVAVRRHDTADAGPPRLDGEPGRGSRCC